MPALTTITTGNIMIFDISKDLHLPLDSEYYKKGEKLEPSDAKTHYTAAQFLKTALANIESYARQSSLSSVMCSHPVSSQLLVVGTHLDLCGDTKDEQKRLQEVEKIIREDVVGEDILHGCSSISVIRRSKGKKTKIIHPIASKNDKESNEATTKDREEAAQEIRTAIESMSNKNIVNEDVPISWLLFQYEVKLHSGPFILRKDCEEIAKKCYINDTDVDDILLFFHELGVFLYYKEVKKLEHIVFSDPQWLFNQLTKLIEFKYDPPLEAEKCINKGIFKKDFLVEIYQKDTDEVLKYENLLDLFAHLNIMARLDADVSGDNISDIAEYFMPALLDPAPRDIAINEVFGKIALSTLCIKFKDGFFPRGVFCCLIALSIQTYKNWSLQTNAAYKDLIVFQIEDNNEYLVLCDKINFISVEIYHKEVLLPNNHQVLCYKLHENLLEVCRKILLNGDFKFGFLHYCNVCKTERFLYAQMQYPCCPENLLCSSCQHKSRMNYNQLIWFVPPKVIIEILSTKVSS